MVDYVDQLIQQIVERTGVSQNVARTAVQYMGGFLKDKAPQYGPQIDGFLGVQGAATPPELGQVKTVDQLSGMMSQRLGIPESTSRSVIQVTGDFLKKKAPPALNTQIDAALGKGGVGLPDSAKPVFGGTPHQEDRPHKQ